VWDEEEQCEYERRVGAEDGAILRYAEECGEEERVEVGKRQAWVCKEWVERARRCYEPGSRSFLKKLPKRPLL
jgi:hypothetical protein